MEDLPTKATFLQLTCWIGLELDPQTQAIVTTVLQISASRAWGDLATLGLMPPNTYNVRVVEVTVPGIPSEVMELGHTSRLQISRFNNFSQELREHQRVGDAWDRTCQ